MSILWLCMFTVDCILLLLLLMLVVPGIKEYKNANQKFILTINNKLCHCAAVTNYFKSMKFYSKRKIKNCITNKNCQTKTKIPINFVKKFWRVNHSSFILTVKKVFFLYFDFLYFNFLLLLFFFGSPPKFKFHIESIFNHF